ncbi:MAG: glycosyltransferase family 39 protein [Chloroflexi bacterium]|nr:glycosyltransferase family 39 protein [Chloroflexota bacterium]
MVDVVALGLVAHLGLLLLPLPFGRDQGIYAYGGSLILRGEVLYLDTWQNPAPAIYWTYALAEWFFGHSIMSIRIVEWVALLAGCWLAARVAATLFGRGAGYAAMAAYALLYVPLDPWFSAQAECFANVFSLAGLYLLVRRGDGHQRWRLVVAGGLFGAALCYKPTLALWPLALVLWLALSRRKEAWAHGLLDAVSFAAGVGAVLAAAAAYFVATGALGELVSQVGTFNMVIYRETARHASWGAWVRDMVDDTLASLFSIGWAGFSILAIASTLWLVATRTARKPAPVLLMGVAAVLAVYAQPHQWIYHWIPIFPYTAILAGTALAATIRGLREAPDRLHTWIAITVLALGVAGSVWPCLVRAGDVIRIAVGLKSPTEFYERFSTYGRGDFSFLAEMEVADYLRAHTMPEDFVQVWGFEAGINFLADRRCPTRFSIILPFVIDRKGHPLTQRWFADFLRDLDLRRPLYFIVVEQDYNPVQRVDSKTALSWYPQLVERLKTQYQVETVIEHFTLYRRVD